MGVRKVGIFGGSGYVGGELLRILLGHGGVEVAFVTSKRFEGKAVHKVHPNLRGLTDLKFSSPAIPEAAELAELFFLALPHGSSAPFAAELLKAGKRVVDLSADFRLKNGEEYERWYRWKHPFPELLREAVLGLPELHRDEIRGAQLVAVPGCMATAAILGLFPVVSKGLVNAEPIVIDAKIGSSGGGASPTLEGYHPERYGVVRPYQPVGHRHIAEIEQEVGSAAAGKVVVSFTPHAVNMVRGILCTIHAFQTRELENKDVWKAYRESYEGEPFVRLVKDPTILHGLPDPKVLAGSNYCDIGFELDEHAKRLVIFSAIDNLIKGAAGNAVQCMNLMLGEEESKGLKSPGIHPV
ncbi:MAG: N-acetyl-gamma-glutamyl-phosphate reductase [Candidatus Brockarchaeota archaeon]|nr:N-acetyl-gamma-glutamyl-phosphate reductase [Candidatus Brockarchaeota archaeon]